MKSTVLISHNTINQKDRNEFYGVNAIKGIEIGRYIVAHKVLSFGCETLWHPVEMYCWGGPLNFLPDYHVSTQLGLILDLVLRMNHKSISRLFPVAVAAGFK